MVSRTSDERPPEIQKNTLLLRQEIVLLFVLPIYVSPIFIEQVCVMALELLSYLPISNRKISHRQRKLASRALYLKLASKS